MSVFFEKATGSTIYFYLNKNVCSPFFVKLYVCRRLSIIKVFLKNFPKFTDVYMYRRLLSDEFEGCKLKRGAGANVFKWCKFC